MAVAIKKNPLLLTYSYIKANARPLNLQTEEETTMY